MAQTNFIPFWDERKSFYKLFQNGEDFNIKENAECILEDRLVKLNRIDDYPVRPFIARGKVFLYNYDRGLEVHCLDGSEQKFIDVRAAWQLTFAGDILFLQKRTDLVTVDIESAEIIDKIHVSESFDIIKLKEYLLFYRFKRNKSYLYNIETKEYLELPNFNSKFEIITQGIKKENKLIIFYAAAKKLENSIGVYIYDIEKKEGFFYCALLGFSANCHKYLDLIEFSSNDLGETRIAINNYKNYIEYLQFVLDRFGFYALLYYIDNKKLDVIENSYKRDAIKKILEHFSKKMSDYPSDNKEFELLLNDMEMVSRQLKTILINNN